MAIKQVTIRTEDGRIINIDKDKAEVIKGDARIGSDEISMVHATFHLAFGTCTHGQRLGEEEEYLEGEED